VDVLTARSRLLDDRRIGAYHLDIATRARQAIAALRIAEQTGNSAADSILLDRARKLQAFFPQPLFVAEPFNKRPGSYLSRADAVRGGAEILNGRHDDLPVEASYFSGSIEEIRGGGALA
jgi:F-type H+/Na+-transporting ATPase subunit beta